MSPPLRSALRAWADLADFAPPTGEMEGMVRLFFAEHGTRDQQALEALAALCDTATDAAAERDRFPQRRAMIAVNLALMVRLHETVRDWTVWAEQETARWPAARQRGRSVARGPEDRGAGLMAAIAELRPPTR